MCIKQIELSLYYISFELSSCPCLLCGFCCCCLFSFFLSPWFSFLSKAFHILWVKMSCVFCNVNTGFHLYLAPNLWREKFNVKLTLLCCRTAQEKTKCNFFVLMCETFVQMCLKQHVCVWRVGCIYFITFFFFFKKQHWGLGLRTKQSGFGGWLNILFPLWPEPILYKIAGLSVALYWG